MSICIVLIFIVKQFLGQTIVRIGQIRDVRSGRSFDGE